MSNFHFDDVGVGLSMGAKGKIRFDLPSGFKPWGALSTRSGNGVLSSVLMLTLVAAAQSSRVSCFMDLNSARKEQAVTFRSYSSFFDSTIAVRSKSFNIRPVPSSLSFISSNVLFLKDCCHSDRTFSRTWKRPSWSS